VVIAATACGGTSPQTVQLREAVAAAAGRVVTSAVAFRLPARRGPIGVFDLPSLEEIAWRTDPAPGGTAPVGFAADEDLLYVLRADTLMALDLRIGRFRTLDTLVTEAVMSPVGAVLVGHVDGGLAVAAERRLTPAGKAGAGTIDALWWAAGDRSVVLAHTDSGAVIRVLPQGGGRPTSVRVPRGLVARSPWGEALAVAGTDGRLEISELLNETPPVAASLPDSALAVTFSGSGHRVYVATAAPAFVIYERFEGDRIATVPLDERVTALRADPFGRYVFGRGDTDIVVYDNTTGAVRTLRGAWADDLPAAGLDGTILLRQHKDVVALAAGDTVAQHRVRGGAADRWLIAPWDARRRDLQLAEAAEEAGTATTAPGQAIYLQVSSTSNAQWAEGLASGLRQAGLQARVLPPTDPDQAYRVVIGPYPTREQAEAVGRKLDMPYWIFTADSTATPH
jgi:SPOR domain